MQIEFIASYPSPGRGPVGLVWNGRFLYNADYTAGAIFQIDCETGGSERALVCPGNLSGLAWDGRSLWQSLHDGGTLRCINPETNDFDQTIMVWEHGWLSGVAWDGQQLWAVSQQKGKIFALDRESGKEIRTIPCPAAGGGLAYHNGSLWLGAPETMRFDETYQQFEWVGDSQAFALIEIEPENGRILSRTSLPFLPMGITWTNDDLWMVHTGAAKLHRTRLK